MGAEDNEKCQEIAYLAMECCSIFVGHATLILNEPLPSCISNYPTGENIDLASCLHELDAQFFGIKDEAVRLLKDLGKQISKGIDPASLETSLVSSWSIMAQDMDAPDEIKRILNSGEIEITDEDHINILMRVEAIFRAARDLNGDIYDCMSGIKNGASRCDTTTGAICLAAKENFEDFYWQAIALIQNFLPNEEAVLLYTHQLSGSGLEIYIARQNEYIAEILPKVSEAMEELTPSCSAIKQKEILDEFGRYLDFTPFQISSALERFVDIMPDDLWEATSNYSQKFGETYSEFCSGRSNCLKLLREVI